MSIDLSTMATFGVAGNFTGHLEQAGEATDFTNVKTVEAKAPKAVFPTFIPNAGAKVPDYLKVFPFDSRNIIFPTGEQNLQIEPECAIVCELTWNDNRVTSLKPVSFAASNDCSIRKAGARKISEKKNWGRSSKGFSDTVIPIDSFSTEGAINNFRIASFLIRDGVSYAYGEDSAVRDYSYIYDKLLVWLVDKLNNQADEGPAENIGVYLRDAGCPNMAMISIGATRYTEFGEHNYLKNGDLSVVVVYPEKRYSKTQIEEQVAKLNFAIDGASVLCQKVIV